MSCWRVLQLSAEVQGKAVPQLLIKTQFGSSSYTVFLTDLSNIWSEDLDLSCIVRRASDVESPIEVSERDTSQLAILFENVQNSLTGSEDSSRAISRDKSDNLMLHTKISLPEPLDSLTWKFYLNKRPAVTLKDELVLPLLVSSHVQHVRISHLLAVISDKDRAITRLVDQYESSNLDLAAAFPSIGNAKSGRRLFKREQAARYIPGLQNFDPDTWRTDTAEMVDPDVSTLGLFQEALFECTPKVPPKLKSDDDEDSHWWKDLETSVNVSKRAATMKPKTRLKETPAPARPAGSDSETEDEEAEDGFETHEHFKSRDLTKRPEPPATRKPAPKIAHLDVDIDGTTVDEDMEMDKDEDDDEDLDVPSKVQSQSQSQNSVPRGKAPTPGPSPPKAASPIRADSPPPKTKARGFKIGGRAKKVESPPIASREETSKSIPHNESIPSRSKTDEIVAGPKPAKKGFKIGGRSKTQTAAGTEEMTASGGLRAKRDTFTVTQSSSVGPSASTTTKVEKQPSPAENEREETEEEKVERKRQELKRKNEEIAKKQAQSKKKKRF